MKYSSWSSAMIKSKRIYALYKGEKFIADGTLRELAHKTNRTYDTLYFYTTPAYQRRVENSKNNLKNKSRGRLKLIELKDEEDLNLK